MLCLGHLCNEDAGLCPNYSKNYHINQNCQDTVNPILILCSYKKTWLQNMNEIAVISKHESFGNLKPPFTQN